ncbi:MAG: hypothetical protein Q4F28_03195 [Eubacteriales bacterium]|nr:hypothetical protein [Eubacteriales bacterium]
MNFIILSYHLLFSNVVRMTVENRIGKYGFKYEGKGIEGWRFSRNIDDIVETVAITIILRYYSELRMELYTDVLGTTSSWIDVEYVRDINDLRKTLDEFCDTFDKKGEKVLNKMHVPHLKSFPSKELRIYLYENMELIYSRCPDRENFPINDYKQVCKKIAEEIRYLKDRPLDENVKKRLMELTVILGKAEINRFGWKWRWRQRQDWFDLVTKNNKFRDDPLLSIFTVYSNQHLASFLNNYESYEKMYGK